MQANRAKSLPQELGGCDSREDEVGVRGSEERKP